MSQSQAKAQPRFEGSVAPAFPLALLESVRSHDRPDEILEDEDLTISLPRRLGLTGIVGQQIFRYEAEQRAHRSVRFDEVMQLIKLVMRRPDAEPILREAGQRVARWRFSRLPDAYVSLLHRAPNRLGARAARRGARRILRELRLGSLIDVSRPFTVRLTNPAAAAVDADSPGCTLVTALLEEVAVRFTGHEARFTHDTCAARGGNECIWNLA